VSQVAWLPEARGLVALANGESEEATQVEAAQIWLVPLPKGAPRRVTSDLLAYRIVSLTADGSSLVTVAADSLASLWVQPRDGKGRPRRLTSSKVDGMRGLDFAPDGRIVYTSAEGGGQGLWVTRADAGERSPLPAGEGEIRAPLVTRSGQVYYLARTRSTLEIRRLPLDGPAPHVVVAGALDEGFAVSPDEQFVVYGALRDGESRLFRASTSGGAPEALTDFVAFSPAFSPDGTKLAFYYVDRATKRFRIGIAPAEGGPPERSLEADPPPAGSGILFREDGLYLNVMPGDRANVWQQPLDGRPPRRITDFQDFVLYGFAVSPDGKWLAYSRGPRTRDAVLIRGFW
jgi:Tol biopolymer transport system component